MDQDTIEQQEETVVGTRNNDRLALFEQISDSSEEARAEEFNAEDLNHDVQTQVEEQSAATTQYAPLPKIKVNGQEVDLTPEILERAQKVAAADEYLSQAARLKREAEQNAKQPSREDVAQHVEADDIALVRALQMGTEEEALEAIRRLRAPSVNPDEIMGRLKGEMEKEEAVKKFQSEYPIIWEDPMLTKLAFARDNELIAQNPEMRYWQRYETIGKELMEWSGKHKTDLSDKKQRKEAAVENSVQTQSRRAEKVQEEEVEETAQDIISAMARKRGQIQ